MCFWLVTTSLTEIYYNKNTILTSDVYTNVLSACSGSESYCGTNIMLLLSIYERDSIWVHKTFARNERVVYLGVILFVINLEA